MKKKAQPGSGYVKKETTLFIALIALVAGFIGGVLFSSFKMGSSMREQAPMSHEGAQEKELSAKQAARIPALKMETSLNPEDHLAWSRLGNAYFDTDRFEDAIRAYKKSLELNNKNANVWTDLGVMYRRNGQPAKAVEAFVTAAEVDPQHEPSRFNRGIVLMHDLNDPEGAIRAWEELLKINPLATTANGQPIMELIAKMKESGDR